MHSMLASGPQEPFIERRDGGNPIQCGEQHAAVRQLQPGVNPEPGEGPGGVGRERRFDHAKVGQRGKHLIHSALPNG